MPNTRSLFKRTLLLICFGPMLLFLLTSSLLGGAISIEVGNAVLLALAAGIAVAYAPISLKAMFSGGRFVQSENVLGTGIFWWAISVIWARTFSLVWRELGQPVEWLNWGMWGLYIGFATSAALCLLVAPEAIRGSLPSEEWGRIGAIVAAGVGLFALISIYVL
jgi:hypothetical protein